MKPLVEETAEDSESGHIYSPCQLVHPSWALGCGKQYRWGHWESSRSQSCVSSLHLKDQRRSRVWQCLPAFLALEGLKHEDRLQVQASLDSVSKAYIKNKIQILPPKSGSQTHKGRWWLSSEFLQPFIDERLCLCHWRLEEKRCWSQNVSQASNIPTLALRAVSLGNHLSICL